MRNARYLPVNDLELADWFRNFNTQMSMVYHSHFGFTPAELADIHDEAVIVQSAVEYKEQLHRAAKSITSWITDLKSGAQFPPSEIPAPGQAPVVPSSVLNGILKRTAIRVRRIKHHENYSESAAIDLRILSPAAHWDERTVKPNLSVTIKDTFPALTWQKGKAQGAFIYVDRRNGDGFTFLQKTVRRSFTDKTSLPVGIYKVTWDYKIIYMRNDKEIGVFSETVSVTVVRV